MPTLLLIHPYKLDPFTFPSLYPSNLICIHLLSAHIPFCLCILLHPFLSGLLEEAFLPLQRVHPSTHLIIYPVTLLPSRSAWTLFTSTRLPFFFYYSTTPPVHPSPFLPFYLSTLLYYYPISLPYRNSTPLPHPSMRRLYHSILLPSTLAC